MNSITSGKNLIDRRTAAEWEAYDPVLLDGEAAQETDTARVKVGDGSSRWSALPYCGAGDIEPITDEEIDALFQ